MVRRIVFPFILFLLAIPAWGQHAPSISEPGPTGGKSPFAGHEHGVARLDVAFEGEELLIVLESPLANLLAFERAPRTDAERREVRSLRARLEKAEGIFLLPEEAACHLETVRLHAPLLSIDAHEHDHTQADTHTHTHAQTPETTATGAKHAEEETHGDLEGTFVFHCAKPKALRQIDIRLFKAFPRLREIAARLIVAGEQPEQHAHDLTPDTSLLKW